MKTLRWLGLCLAFTMLAAGAWAQSDSDDDAPMTLAERLYYTGGANLQLGNNATFIGVSPMIGYKFTPIFSLGLGIDYQYSKLRGGVYLINGIPYTVGVTQGLHSYGGKIFGRALLPIRVFVHAEWQTLNSRPPVVAPNIRRQWYSATLVGAGYSFGNEGSPTSLNIMMLYNLNRSANEALYRSEFVPRVEVAYNF